MRPVIKRWWWKAGGWLLAAAVLATAGPVAVRRYLHPPLVPEAERPVYTVGDASYVKALLAGQRVVKLGPLPGNFLYAGGVAFGHPDEALHYLRENRLTGLGWGVFELNGDYDRDVQFVAGEARLRRSMCVTRQVYPLMRLARWRDAAEHRGDLTR